MGESIVTRLLARLGVALAIFMLTGPPALAQVNNYDVIDAHGATKTMGAKGVGVGPTVLHGLHLVEGLNGGVPTPVNQTVAGQLDVNCVTGCASGGTSTVVQPSAAALNATVVGTVGLSGTLPAFAATPTFNCGTGCSAGAGTAQGAASAGVTGGLSFGLVGTSAPTYTNATVNGLSLDTSGGLRISASALPLPTGSATSTNQATEITALGLLHTDNGSLSTSALQTTANGSLATIASGVPDVVPAPGTITAADVGTTTIAGQGSVTLITGTPTANSFQSWAVNGRSSMSLTTTGTFVETIQLEGSTDGVTFAPISGLLRGSSTTTASITAPGIISAEVSGFSTIRARASAFTSGTATLTPRFSVSPGPVKITNPLPAGTNPIGGVSVTAVTTGGATPYHFITTASTNATLISTGAHTLYSLTVTGLNSTAGYVRIYDLAGAPTCSSSTGAVHTYPVIGSATQQGGMIIPLPSQGELYANGIGFCATGGSADNDNTSGPSGIVINASYK